MAAQSSPNNQRILFLAPYPLDKAPSQRLKYEQYYSFFEKAGYEVTTSSFISTEFWKIVYKKGYFFSKLFFTLQGYIRRFKDLFRLKKYDLVYVHLWVTPFGWPVFEYLVNLLAKRVIYDIDDMIFLGHQSKANPLIAMVKGKTKPIFLMKKAAHVIVCTPTLDQFVQKYNQNTTDISSTINCVNYQPVNTYTNQERLTIGWSGSHSTAKYLQLLRPVLLALQKTHAFKLLVIGATDFEMEGIEHIETLAWTAETEILNLQKIDIGVYPLPNEKWVLGKSGLKALQYMALGLPTVATSIGANSRIIADKVSGLLVDNKQAWLNSLQMLLDNPALRKKIGQAARKQVLTHYSLQANKEKYLTVFSQPLNRK